MNESLQALARHGDRVGAVLALETGLESGAVLAAYLRRFDTGALGANFDPANLVVHGLDPYQSARDLRGLVRHAHATDARRSSPGRAARSVPLGEGDIDWMRLLGVLEEIEYRGWLVVARPDGEGSLADVAAGVALLRRILP
jgi:sugar phosphate isomerase/epimerase